MITVRGLGAENPIASNATKDGRLKNQRVEVEFQMSQKSYPMTPDNHRILYLLMYYRKLK